METFEQTGAMRDMWYPSKLDLLDLEDVPTYGGMTNRALLEDLGLTEQELDQQSRQSYVVRLTVTPDILEGFCAEEGAPDPTNSWFPPYEWTNLYCKTCDESLGWLFTLPDLDTSAPSQASNVSGSKPWGSCCRRRPQPVEDPVEEPPSDPFIALRVTSLREGTRAEFRAPAAA